MSSYETIVTLLRKRTKFGLVSPDDAFEIIRLLESLEPNDRYVDLHYVRNVIRMSATLETYNKIIDMGLEDTLTEKDCYNAQRALKSYGKWLEESALRGIPWYRQLVLYFQTSF